MFTNVAWTHIFDYYSPSQDLINFIERFHSDLFGFIDSEVFMHLLEIYGKVTYHK